MPTWRSYIGAVPLRGLACRLLEDTTDGTPSAFHESRTDSNAATKERNLNEKNRNHAHVFLITVSYVCTFSYIVGSVVLDVMR